MSTYTITITPEDGSGAEAVVRVETDGDTTRIAEFTVRPGAGARTPEPRVSAVDFDMLLRAIGPAVAAGLSRPARLSPATQVRRTRTEVARRSRQTAVGRRPRASNNSSTNRVAEARVYRRMPDDLVETFAEIGSVTALAAHYGVPRHTAQGWINRMRKTSA